MVRRQFAATRARCAIKIRRDLSRERGKTRLLRTGLMAETGLSDAARASSPTISARLTGRWALFHRSRKLVMNGF